MIDLPGASCHKISNQFFQEYWRNNIIEYQCKRFRVKQSYGKHHGLEGVLTGVKR